MDVQREWRAAQRRMKSATERRCAESLRRLGIEPEPEPHPAEATGYQLRIMMKSLTDGLAALGRGIQRGMR